MPATDACPCGSGKLLAECCGAFLRGLNKPATAVALMRSRYTAYALREEAYLLKTWHPKTRPAALDLQGDATVWEALRILRRAAGGEGDREGVVEFVASYRQDGQLRQLRELSHFMREAGDWLYLDGEIKQERENAAKPGRNEPCPCGSGKKYKKCCGG